MNTHSTQTLDTAVTLPGGVDMPQLGYGTWKLAEGDQAREAVGAALERGYRHVDTAAVYGNERSVGEAIRASGLPREEVFVTTKLWNDDQRRGAQREAFDTSLRKLGLEYVDLYLIHWPVRDRIVESWRVLEQLQREGRVRAIGVSNFLEHDLDALSAESECQPAVNQIELHPLHAQRGLAQSCKEKGIVVEAWSPLGRGEALGDQTITRIASQLGRTPAQVVLRWQIQKGYVTIPKSAHRKRIDENACVFDFELTDAMIADIDALDAGHRVGPDPADFSF